MRGPFVRKGPFELSGDRRVPAQAFGLECGGGGDRADAPRTPPPRAAEASAEALCRRRGPEAQVGREILARHYAVKVVGRRQGRQRSRRSVQAQPPARRGGRGERLIRLAHVANRPGRRGDPTSALEAGGNRGDLPLAEIRTRGRAGLPPAGQADRLSSSGRGAGLPSGASGPNPAEGAGNPLGPGLVPGVHAQPGRGRQDAAPNRRSPRGEPAGFQFRSGAGPDIAGRRHRARPSPFELRFGRLVSPPRIQQNLRKCRDRVESAPKFIPIIQLIARRRFARLPTRAKIGTS